MEIKRGDIYYIKSGRSTGSEQRSGRPAVVVSNDKNNKHSSTVEVVYLTTQPKQDLPTHAHIYGIEKESTVICEQIITVAIERFGDYKGRVTAEEMADIEAALLASLNLHDLISIEANMLNSEEPQKRNTLETQLATLKTRLIESETKCAMLQRMYDELLGRLIQK